MPIHAVLQGAGLISGLVRIEILDSGKCAEFSIVVGSLEISPTYCETDQFLFNLSSFYAEKKQILLKGAEYIAKDGIVQRGDWELVEDVDTTFGRFYYALICSDERKGKPLGPGDTLIFQLVPADGKAVFTEDSFIEAPASTFNGFQAAFVIKFPGNKHMLAGGQFEPVPE